MPLYNPVPDKPRIGSITSSATPTPTGDTVDQFEITALAAGATIAAPATNPYDGQKIIIRILDNGVAQTLAWNAVYTPIGASLPTTTVAGKYLYVACIYNSQSSKWDVMSVAVEPGGLSTYTVTNASTDRTFDASTVGTTELANVVATLISDLRNRGLVG